MSATTSPGALRAIGILASLTLRRSLRSRAIWLSLFLATLPTVFALIAGADGSPRDWRRTFNITTFLLALIPPLHMAGVIGDEMDEKTITFLWSRPIARWVVLVGKLTALIPICAAVLLVAVGLPKLVVPGFDGSDVLRGGLAVCLGVLAIGITSAGIGSLATRFSLPTAVMYMLLIDLPMSAVPFQIQEISIFHQIRQISQVDPTYDPTGPAVAMLLCMAAVWIVIAVWRTRRAEPPVDR